MTSRLTVGGSALKWSETFSSFLKLTFLWPTHIRRKPNHCKTHYLYCSCPQILVTYMFICASKIWGPGPKPVLFRSQKPVFEAPECWTGSPLVQPTRDSMWASLSLSSKFSNKNSDKKNNFAWNFWGPCDRKYWLGICPKEWDGLTQCNETNSINMGPKGKISWSKPNKFPY